MTICMVAFERAIINSSHAAFPDIDIRCCWYYYVQTLWRKCQKLGFSTTYETDPLVNSCLTLFMALPLISKRIIHDGLQLLKDTVLSTDNHYYKLIKYFEEGWIQRTSVDSWHHSSSKMKINSALEGYNFRIFLRLGLHPSMWEFIYYVKDEEALVSHRITDLVGGSEMTSSTLIYLIMQSKRKSKKNKKHLLHLEELFDSSIIGVKEYLNSASSMIGKIPSQNDCGDEVVDGIKLITDQNEKD